MKRLAQVAGGARPLAVDGKVDAMIAQYADEQIDVGEIRNVLQRQPVFGQKAGDQQRQGGVLGAGNRNRAVEGLPPLILIRSINSSFSVSKPGNGEG